MILSALEKFIYGVTLLVLFLQGRMHGTDLMLGGVDTLLGVLFLVAFVKTRAAPRTA